MLRRGSRQVGPEAVVEARTQSGHAAMPLHSALLLLLPGNHVEQKGCSAETDAVQLPG